MTVRAAAFYDLWSHIQSDQYRPSGLAYTANVGDARIAGVEAELAIDFSAGLSLQANALLAAQRFTHPNPDFARSIRSGSPGAPRTSGGVLARYAGTLGAWFHLGRHG